MGLTQPTATGSASGSSYVGPERSGAKDRDQGEPTTNDEPVKNLAQGADTAPDTTQSTRRGRPQGGRTRRPEERSERGPHTADGDRQRQRKLVPGPGT